MKTSISKDSYEEWVVIKEEEQEWVQKLSHTLSKNDIPSRILLAPGCSAGQCRCTFLLLVEKDNVQAALNSIDEYYMELHPEIRESKEWADQGRCPACGHHVGIDAIECSDCGLRLIIEES